MHVVKQKVMGKDVNNIINEEFNVGEFSIKE